MLRNLSTSNLFEPNKEELLKCFRGYDGNFERIANDLESELKSYHNSEHCVLFSTGFWALVAAAKIKKKNNCVEVIMPSFTYRRLADVAFWAGLSPVFVDVDAKTLAISPVAINSAISDKTALILAVHPIVGCCDVDEIVKISSIAEIPIIFDAVESVHETMGARRIGSFGPGEVFSLHASKLLNGLEGGYVCTNDKNFAQQLTQFRNGKFEGSVPLRIDPIHALFALQSVREIKENVEHNKLIYGAYKKRLANHTKLELQCFDETEQSAYKNIVAKVNENNKFTRDELVSYLNENDAMARRHYSPPLHDKKHSFSTKQLDLVATNIVKSQFINLPCGQRVSLSDVKYVCDLIESFSHEG